MARNLKLPPTEPDAELLDHLCQLAQDLRSTISTQGWGGLSVGPLIRRLRDACATLDVCWRQRQEELRQRRCRRRFGRLADGDLSRRISEFERQMMSQMEVSGLPSPTLALINEQWQCACFVASERPDLWARLTAEGLCRGAVSPQANPCSGGT